MAPLQDFMHQQQQQQQQQQQHTTDTQIHDGTNIDLHRWKGRRKGDGTHVMNEPVYVGLQEYFHGF